MVNADGKMVGGEVQEYELCLKVMSRRTLIPLGPGPPVDDESDGEDFDSFNDLEADQFSDEEDHYGRRKRKVKEEEETHENVTPPFLLQPKSDKPKKLSFSGHGAGCTRGGERIVRVPVQPPRWNPKSRSRPLTSPAVSNTASRFNVADMPDAWPDLFQAGTSVRETVEGLTSVPTGSYEEDKRWLKRVEDLWSQKSSRDIRAVTEMLEQIFATVPNPYVTALSLMEGAHDYKQGKAYTLSMTVAREFEKWARDNAADFKHCLSQDIKIAAFQVALQGHLSPLELMGKAFELNHPGNEYFLRLVQPLIEKRKYKEAGQCISKLGLHEHYSIKDVCFPLLLQDKVNLVESYLFRKKTQQEALLQVMDWLMDDDTDIDDVIRSYSHVPSIRREKLEFKPLHKLAVRLMKLYQIPDDMCPNICTKRSLKGVRYLLYMKYLENTATQEQFEELMQAAVGDSVQLQEQLVDAIIDYLDIPEAARWALFYRLTRDQMPSQVRWAIYEDKIHEQEGFKPIRTWSSVPEESDDDNDDAANNSYYRSPNLTPESIHFVDTRDDFIKCMRDVITTPSPVGLDCEWRPNFGQTTPSRLSLMQLGTTDHVYLLDVLALMDILNQSDWLLLVRDFLCNTDILKLGYGIQSDLHMLANALPYLEKDMQQMKSIIDLQIVHDSFKKIHPEVFRTAESRSDSDSSSNQLQKSEKSENIKEAKQEHTQSVQTQSISTAASQTESESGTQSSSHSRNKTRKPLKSSTKVIKGEERGLSELVRLCFGKPLSKKERISDWERRPLRHPQIQYAALDARCLCEIFEFIERRLATLDLDIDLREVLPHRRQGPKRSNAERRQKRVEDRTEQKQILSGLKNPDPVTGEPLPVSDFRVVVDNMLQGLGRQLRSCGADVKVLGNKDRHDICARIANAENRIILTSGMPFATLRSAVPLGRCYSVGAGTAKQQVAAVLQQFNVTVTQSDIFTRCQVCNGNEYLFISPVEMKEAWHIKRALLLSASSQKHVTSSKLVQSDVTAQKIQKTASNTFLKNSDEPKHDRVNGSGTKSTSTSISSCDTKDHTKSMDSSTSVLSTGQDSSGTEVDTQALNTTGVGHGSRVGIKSEEGVEWKPFGRGAVWQGSSEASGLKPRARGRGVFSIPSLSKLISTPGAISSFVQSFHTGSRNPAAIQTGNQSQDEHRQGGSRISDSTLPTRESSVDPAPDIGNNYTADDFLSSKSTSKDSKSKIETKSEIGKDTKSANKEPKRETGNDTEKEMTLEEFMAVGSDSEADSDSGSECSLGNIDLDTVTVGEQVPVQVENVPEGMLDIVELFFVCKTCGKVFWEGSHFTKVKGQFSHVLSDERDEKSDDTGNRNANEDKSSMTMKAISQGLLNTKS